MNWLKNGLIYGLIGASFLLNNFSSKQENLSYPVYDFERKSFVTRLGGVDEDVLNSLDNSKHKSKKYIDYYQNAEDLEHSLEFGIKYLEDNIFDEVVLYNMALIEKVDKSIDVDKKYKPLKELLVKCNKIYHNTKEKDIERVIKLYDLLSYTINRSEGVAPYCHPIDTIITNMSADNSGVVAAFFALFNYYHIRCNYMEGSLIVNKKNQGHHRWLWINIGGRAYKDFNGVTIFLGGQSFSLDPTWYRSFVPLDNRNYDMHSRFFTEPLMRRKPKLGNIY